MAATSPSPRRRRSPEEARGEILAAARLFLRDRPFRELTVDEVMARTGLSRPSFYVYFRDRHQLLLSLVGEIGGELFAMAERWLKGDDDPVAGARAALEGVAGVYAEHGRALKAISDAATTDPEVETIYRALLGRFVEATAEHIEEEIAAGRMLPFDARETARALVWMNDRYLTEAFGGTPPTPLPQVLDTLERIWLGALYGVSP